MAQKDSEYRIFYITFPDFTTAENLAHKIVDERLAACANLIPGMTSIYHWEKKVQASQETVMILKSRAHLKGEIEALLHAEHPYHKMCCLLEIPVGGAPAFLQWISENTR